MKNDSARDLVDANRGKVLNELAINILDTLKPIETKVVKAE